MALIRCENVSIGYEGQIVVKDLNFQIASGDYLCIVGENGSGKKYAGKKPPGTQICGKRTDNFRGRPAADGNRLSAPADGCSERFSCQRV